MYNIMNSAFYTIREECCICKSKILNLYLMTIYNHKYL